jgi:soluble cytochrome b562
MNKKSEQPTIELFEINLQLFAEGDPAPTGSVPAPASDGGQPGTSNEPASTAEPLSLSDRVDKFFQEAMTGDQNQQQGAVADKVGGTATTDVQPTQEGGAPNASQQDNLILGKFKNTEEVFKGYVNLESDYTRKSQMLSDIQKAADTLKTENEQLVAKINELTNNSQSSKQQPTKEPSDELSGLDTEEYMNKFYESPQEVIAKTVESIVKKVITPLEDRVKPVMETVEAQKTQELWDTATRDFYKNNPDMVAFKDGMKQYIVENNLQNSNNPGKVLKDALVYAKGLSYKAPEPVNPKTLLSDESFLTENVLKNPDIVNRILKEHMQDIKNNSAPPTITGQSAGGQPTATPPNKPKNLEEAHDRLEAMLKGHIA